MLPIADDVGLRDIDRLSRHCGGQDHPVRDRPRLSVHVGVERWHGWGAAGKG